MPDYALCKNEECKKRYTCRRFNMKPDPDHQNYVLIDNWEKCTVYWPMGITVDCVFPECINGNKR